MINKKMIMKALAALAKRLERYRTVTLTLSVLVVFITTYLLILPAITLDKDEADRQGGIDVPAVEETAAIEDETPEPTEEEPGSVENSIEEPDETGTTESEQVDTTSDEPAEKPVEHVDDVHNADALDNAGSNRDAYGSGELVYEGNGFTVRATYGEAAEIPDGTELVVHEIVQNTKEYDYDEYYDLALNTVNETSNTENARDIEYVRFFDITLMADGQEVQPQDTVNITIDFDKAHKVSTPEDVKVLHFTEDWDGELAAEVLDEEATGVTVNRDKMESASFDAESFSVYAVVYTVDFYWEVDGQTYEFNLPGGGFISVESLVKALNLADRDRDKNLTEEETQRFVDDIENVTFSDPELIWVGKVETDTTVGDLKAENELQINYSTDLTEVQAEALDAKTVEAGDWALISLKPFHTEESLTITMKTGEVFTVRVTDRASQNPQNTKISRSDMNVDNREEGILIKLFDYSGTVDNNGTKNIDAVWGNATNSNALRTGTGVNNGRTLVFSGSGLEKQEWYNNFTGTRPSGMEFYSGYREPGIVKDELVNGYPELSESITRYGRDDGNLDYLFKGGEQDGVVEYSANGEGLQGLLRKDSNGYYYYSSEDNYARFDGNDYIDLYTDTYYKQNGAAAANNNGFGSIGFFPFTNYDPSHNREKGPDTPNDLYYNHQLGMSMHAYFTYPPHGRLDDGQGDPMTFEFSGDDDVWVYVDGKLALDLGGVHQPIKGVIDFANKEVRYYEYDAYNSTNSPKVERVTTVPFSEIFGEDGFDDSSYSTHKLDFFFIERGGCDSNCALSFNLQTLATAEKEFTKVDDHGAGLPGAEFTVYTDEACTEPLSVHNAPLTAISGTNGKVSFKNIPVRRDSEGTPLVYYMKETDSPGGYVENNTTYKLVYNSDTKTYDVFTLDDQSSETIENTPVHPITLGVQKQWQDAAGNPINPDDTYSATFELHRLRSYRTPDEVVTGDEETLRIRHLDNDNTWQTSGEELYNYLRGRTITVNYDYHGTTSHNKREYRYRSNGSNWSYSGSLPDSGSFQVQIPNSGRYEIEFYDSNNAVTWTIDDGAAEGETFVDQPDDFSRTLTLSGSTTSGTFDSGMYAGTADAGKFPLEEEIDGITYTYKYYITETSRTPNNNESVFVDADGKVISDPSAHYIVDDTMQSVINRELLDIPFEKYWDFDSDEAPDAYYWTATLQLESRFIDKTTGEAITTFEPVDGKQLTVTSTGNGQGSFDDLPMFGAMDGTEYRIQYSVSEIAYSVKRNSDNVIVAQWQDPNYYENPVEQIGEKKFTLHYVQDAGENGSEIGDYSIIVNNTPENRVETKAIDISLHKIWPADVDLTNAYADFVLRRYVYEEYRNFPEDTTDWVEITLDTGNDSPQTLRVPRGWEMTIFGNVKSATNAESIEFSDGSTPSGVPVFSYDNSSSNIEYTFSISFTADRTKTVTLVNGSQYVAGGIDGFRLTDINDPNDMVVKKDLGFEIPFRLNDDNDWQATFQHLAAIEEDTQYDVENPLEITRYIYRYYIEETDCSPEDYEATFKDSNGNLFGDEGNRIDNTTAITAENDLKPGSLKITKDVTVNGIDPTAAEAVLVDGDYTFVIAGVVGTPTEGERTTATVTISGGQSNTVIVDGLKPGQYTVTELTPENGTSLVGDNGITLTVEPGKNGDDIPTTAVGEFTNNIDTTDIEFKKDWKQADKTTPYTGNEDVVVTYTLMQVAKSDAGEVVRNDAYEGTYFQGGTAHTATANAPGIFYVTQNESVTITDLPTAGRIGDIPVTFTYYVVEAEIEGFAGDTPAPVSEGDYTITNSEIPETSRTTDVTVEKEWIGDGADQIGGVKFKLIQEKAELPQNGTNAFYPYTIILQDGDGTESQDHVIVFVKHSTSLNIPVNQIGDGDKGCVWRGRDRRTSGQSFQQTSITNIRHVTFRLEDDYTWGGDWELGEITVYNNKGQVSDTPKTFIDQLNSDPETELTYSDTGVEYVVNMPAKGSAEIVGESHEVTTYENQWKATINGLSYYERGEDGKYYTYRYRVAEVSIIDPETKEEIETVVQNPDGSGGESTHFIIAYNNDSDPLTITNTKRPDTDITLKKVDKINVDNPNLTEADLLDGAKFKITKYKQLNPMEKDDGWNRDHSVESEGSNGVFTFTHLTPGIYMLEETQYPTGYSRMEESPLIRVNDDLSIDLIDSTGQKIDGNQTDLIRVVDGTTTIVFGNESGAELPHTGGAGTTALYLIGGLLVAVAGTLLVLRKKRVL